jgi:hypothetical protein
MIEKWAKRRTFISVRNDLREVMNSSDERARVDRAKPLATAA